MELRLPRGACDAHFHVFGPWRRFPLAPERSYTPAREAPKEALFALHDRFGIGRGVVVQSAIHGFDNSAAADLIASRPRSYRGIALLRPDVPEEQLKRLSKQGFVGARFHYMSHLGSHTPIEEVVALGKRLSPLGWHLQIHLDATLLDELAPALHRSSVPVVIDHMGRIDASKGLNDSAFLELLSLLENKNIWVKVSGCERASRQAAPWRDAVPFARKLVAEFPDRVLWGTDWPHPNLKETPDDGQLVALLGEIAPSEAARHKLLVDNPKRFYGFA